MYHNSRPSGASKLSHPLLEQTAKNHPYTSREPRTQHTYGTSQRTLNPTKRMVPYSLILKKRKKGEHLDMRTKVYRSVGGGGEGIASHMDYIDIIANVGEATSGKPNNEVLEKTGSNTP